MPTDSPYGITVYNFDSNGTLLIPTQLIKDMQSIGMGWLRYQQPWPFIESTQTTPATYNWVALDDAVAKCNAAGINIAYTIQGQPTWYPKQSSGYGATFPDPNSTKTFAQAVVSRYTGGSHGSLQAIEIGNEEYDSYGSGTDTNAYNNRSATYYSNVLQVVSPAIRAINPALKIGMCAIWWNQLPHVHDFLTAIYTAGLGTYFDYANFHYYPYESGSNGMIDVGRWCYTAQSASTSPSFMQEWAAIQNVMATNNDTGKEIRVTELGWYSHPIIGANGSRGTTNQVSYDIQQRNYWLFMESARLSGVVSHFFPWTLDYASTYITNRDANNNPISDGDSLVQNQTVSGIAYLSYLPVYTQLQNYMARYPTWTVQFGSTPALLGIDTFIACPNVVSPGPRADNTNSFGNPSDNQSWVHIGGAGPSSFVASEGQIVSSTAGIYDFWLYGSNTALNQENQIRVSTANANDEIGIVSRLNGTAGNTGNTTNNGYALTIKGNLLTIKKIVAGSSTILVQQTVTQTPGTFYRLRLRTYTLSGSTIIKGRYWQEGTLGTFDTTKIAHGMNPWISGFTQEPNNWTITATDTSSQIASGGFGIIALATTSTPIKFDSFMAIDASNIVTKYTFQETITNTGTSSVTFTASVTQPWLSLDATSGTISGGGAHTFIVSADVSLLSTGSYSDTLTITPSSGSALSIPVTITVQ